MFASILFSPRDFPSPLVQVPPPHVCLLQCLLMSFSCQMVLFNVPFFFEPCPQRRVLPAFSLVSLVAVSWTRDCCFFCFCFLVPVLSSPREFLSRSPLHSPSWINPPPPPSRLGRAIMLFFLLISRDPFSFFKLSPLIYLLTPNFSRTKAFFPLVFPSCFVPNPNKKPKVNPPQTTTPRVMLAFPPFSIMVDFFCGFASSLFDGDPEWLWFFPPPLVSPYDSLFPPPLHLLFPIFWIIFFLPQHLFQKPVSFRLSPPRTNPFALFLTPLRVMNVLGSPCFPKGSLYEKLFLVFFRLTFRFFWKIPPPRILSLSFAKSPPPRLFLFFLTGRAPVVDCPP